MFYELENAFFIDNLLHYNFYELKNAFFLSKIDLNNNLGDQIFS